MLKVFESFRTADRDVWSVFKGRGKLVNTNKPYMEWDKYLGPYIEQSTSWKIVIEDVAEKARQEGDYWVDMLEIAVYLSTRYEL